MSAAAAALAKINEGLASVKGFSNYQRWALEAARENLLAGDVDAAVHKLGDAIDHAHRPGWTETRAEVAVCIDAFRILTAKTGGAA